MKIIQPTKIWITRLSDDYDIDSDAVDCVLDEIRPILEQHGFEFRCAETSSLGVKKLSLFKCEECDQLFVNRDLNPMGIDKNDAQDGIDSIIYDGGEYDGKKLCESCLPVTHRWGHHS